jgi:hypothetical protein
MKKHFKLYKVIMPVITSVVVSCSEPYNVDVPESFTRLVVEGYMTTDTMSHKVKLTKTSSYFSNEKAPVVSGAQVYVIVSEGDTLLLHETGEEGIYETDSTVFGIPGLFYTLHIKLNEIIGESDTYESTPEIMPSIKPLDSIALEFKPDWGPSGYWIIKVYAQEPPSRDFYCFKAWKNDTLLTDSIKEYFYTDDELFNGNYTNGITSQYLNQAKPDEVLRPGDKVTFELNSINEGFFRFIYEYQTESGPSIPLFSGPPANVSTNLNNGALGYFAVYSVSKSSTRLKGKVK